MTPEEIAANVSVLVDAWCERRCPRALREILSAWPSASGLTDDWGHLDEALKSVRAFAADELTDSERQRVERLIGQLDRLVLGEHS